MPTKPSTPHASLGIVYATAFIDLLGFAVILPLLPYYARHLHASPLEIGGLLSAYAIAQLVASPLWGRLSDRVGRRPVLLASLFGSTISLAATGMAPTLMTLFAARAFAGLFAGTVGTAQAYIADVTPPERRARSMGMLGASIGMGFIFGPALGGALAHFGFAMAAYGAAAIAGLNLIAATFKLRESLSPDHPARTRPRVPLARLLRTPRLTRLFVATLLGMLSFTALETVFPLLGKDRFGLNDVSMAWMFTYLGVVMVFIQGGLVGRLSDRRGERWVAITGNVLMFVGFVAIAWSHAFALVVVAVGLVAAGQGFARPSITALLSLEADDDAQGAILGLGQGMAAGARATGPLIAGWLYGMGQGQPFVLGAALALATAALLMGFVSRRAHGTEPS